MKLWQRWKRTALHNKALVVTSVLVAFGTLFYAGAAVLQVWIMRESARQTGEQAEKLIQAAKTQAKAAQDFAAAAQDSLKFSEEMEKPFVAIDTFSPSNFPDGSAPGFALTFRNYGRTAARNVSGNLTITISSNNFLKNKKRDPSGDFRFPIIPALSSQNRWLAAVDFERYREAVKSGAVRFYVWGFVSYEDESGNKSLPKHLLLGLQPETGKTDQYWRFRLLQLRMNRQACRMNPAKIKFSPEQLQVVAVLAQEPSSPRW